MRLAWMACITSILKPAKHRQLFKHRSYLSGVVAVDDATLIAAGFDGQLIWYDLQQQQVFRRIQAHRFWSWQLAISPDRRQVASVTGQYLAGTERYEPAPEQEPSVKVYNVGTGELQYALPHVPSVQAVTFSNDGRFLAAGKPDGRSPRLGRWSTAKLVAKLDDR